MGLTVIMTDSLSVTRGCKNTHHTSYANMATSSIVATCASSTGSALMQRVRRRGGSRPQLKPMLSSRNFTMIACSRACRDWHYLRPRPDLNMQGPGKNLECALKPDPT